MPKWEDSNNLFVNAGDLSAFFAAESNINSQKYLDRKMSLAYLKSSTELSF